MGRDNGVSDEKLLALDEYATSDHYDERERAALTYADRITLTDDDVDDELFSRLATLYSEPELLEVTFTVCFENMLSKFHHALLIESQGFCPVRVPSGP